MQPKQNIKRQALCAKRSCYQRLNSEFLPVCLKRPVVHQSSCVFDRLLLSLMFVCEKDDRCLIFECILSCYGQCKVVKCCLCTVCLMSHIFMYSNIHTQCIIHLLLRQYLSSLPVFVFIKIYYVPLPLHVWQVSLE